MSRLQEFGEDLKSKLLDYFDKIKETETYQQLSDRYQSMSPGGQKAVRYTTALLILFIFLFFPLSQISTSKELVTSFEEKRNLIRDLFKSYRDANQTHRLQMAPNIDALLGSVNSTLQSEQLLPEQILSVGVGSAEGRLIPQNLVSHVVDIKLSKLNLRQVVDIGTRLAALSEAVKLKDLSMIANTELAGYFDVTYKLYSLNVPEAPLELPPEPELKSKKKTTDNDSKAKDDEL